MSDEVLVHIATPATRQNDDLFRSLATAYTKFEPCRTHCNSPVRKTARVNQRARRRPNITSAGARTSAIGGPAHPSAPMASKESYGSFPSNVSSEERHLAQDESERPISRLAQLDRSYLSWRECATSKSSFARSEAELRTNPDGLDADTGFIEDSQSALQALQSQLHNTYSTTSADTSEDDDVEHKDLAKPHGQSLHRFSPVRYQESNGAEELSLPALMDDNAQTDINVNMSQETADLSSHATPALRDGLQTTVDKVDFSKLSIDAFPPPPIIAVARPDALPSQITKHLAAIKAKNPTRFKSIKIRRDLENDERGFWRVDCMRWSPNAQRDFWLSLCEHVCSGRVGWAITLHREIGANDKLGLVRLYCWGEIVEHMWLLLWLCSKGRASGIGSKWIDANGIAVIEVD